MLSRSPIKKSTESLVDSGKEKMKKPNATLPPISPTQLQALRASLAEEDMSKNKSSFESRSQSRHSSVSNSHSNLPKLLEMMAASDGIASRRGSDVREQRRPSQNVYDAVDLTATLMAITHSTVDLNSAKPLDDILMANFMEKRNSSFSSTGEINDQMGDDLDVQVPDLEEKQNHSSKGMDMDSTGRNNHTLTVLGSSDARSRQPIDSENASTSGKSTGSDHEVSKRKTSPLHYGTGWEASLMGFTIVAGGQLYGWNALFTAGFGSYFIAQVMVGFAYVILLCCLGENTAALAFPGGSYGLARVCLGFYAGYVVACFEMMEYIFMSSAAVFYVGQMIVSCANLDPSYAPVFWVLFYGFGIATTCSSLKVMWYTSTLLCMVILILVLIYCIGSAKYTNLAVNGPYWNNTATYVPVMGNNNLTYSLDYTTAKVVMQANGKNMTMAMGTPLPPTNLWDPSYWFIGGMTGWMSTLAVCTWGYAGIECLVLMTDMMKEPKKNIPIGCAGGISMLFATNIATTIICAAMPPGLFTTAGNPTYMSMVYQLIFPRLSDAGAWLLILPGQIGMGWGFFAPVGKLLQALGQSNLLPRFLCLNGAESHRTGVVVGCALGLIVCIIGYFHASFGAALQNIAIASGCIQYFANLYAYILLKTTFKQVERDFKSPFGIPGAVLCMCIFMLVLISTLFFQSDGYMGTGEYTTLIVMCALVVFLAVWYYTFVTGAQRFSPSEQKTVFRLHVYQFNMKKNKPKDSENSIFQHCTPIMAMYAMYATLWNKFDKTTKRISKRIDERFDARYAAAWEYVTGLFGRCTDNTDKEKLKEGLSMKSEFSSVGRKSLDNSQVFIAPPPTVTPTVPSSSGKTGLNTLP